MKERFVTDNTRNGHITCRLITDSDEPVSVCEVSVGANNIWDITSWYTKEKFKNRGFGRRTMQKALCACRDQYGEPVSIQYTWNGANAYVLEWLEKHFNAVCTCPVAVQKNQCDDDWSSHIYELEKDRVFSYFNI